MECGDVLKGGNITVNHTLLHPSLQLNHSLHHLLLHQSLITNSTSPPPSPPLFNTLTLLIYVAGSFLCLSLIHWYDLRMEKHKDHRNGTKKKEKRSGMKSSAKLVKDATSTKKCKPESESQSKKAVKKPPKLEDFAVTAPPGCWVRPLGSVEMSFAWGLHLGSFNTVTALWLASPVPIQPHLVRKALTILAQRVAVLQLIVRWRRLRLWFQRMKTVIVDFKVSDDLDVGRVVEGTLAEKYDIARGPLWRVRMVPLKDHLVTPENVNHFTKSEKNLSCGVKKDTCRHLNGLSENLYSSETLSASSEPFLASANHRYKAVLVVAVHHAITDGLTNMVLSRDLLDLLNITLLSPDSQSSPSTPIIAKSPDANSCTLIDSKFPEKNPSSPVVSEADNAPSNSANSISLPLSTQSPPTESPPSIPPHRPVIPALADTMIRLKEWPSIIFFFIYKITRSIVTSNNKNVYFSGALPHGDSQAVYSGYPPTSLLHTELSAELSDSLLARCRSAKVTLHALLLAAVQVALSRVASRRSGTDVTGTIVGIMNCVNSRRFYPASLVEAPGCHICLEDRNVPAKQNDERDIWDLAQRLTADLRQSLGPSRQTIKNTPILRGSILMTEMNVFQSRRGHCHQNDGNMLTSNMGNLSNLLPGTSANGPIEIIHFVRSVSLELSGHPFMLNCHTFRGRLMLSLDHYATKITSEAAMQIFACLTACMSCLASHGTIKHTTPETSNCPRAHHDLESHLYVDDHPDYSAYPHHLYYTYPHNKT